MNTDKLKSIDHDVDYESPNGVDNCTANIDDLHEALWNEYIDDPCLLLHLHDLNVYQIDYPESSLGHPDIFKAARKAFTPIQVIALYHYSNFDAKCCNCPIDRKSKIINALEVSDNLLEYKITDVLEFQEKIRWMHPIFFQDFTNILYRSGIMRYMCPEDNNRLNLFERKVAHAMGFGYQEGRIDISSDSYTIIECSNPNLISSGSKFVNESVSQLLKIQNNQSHFFTESNTMDEELVGLSKKHPNEVFYTSRFKITLFIETFIYYFEYVNGICRELGRIPGYRLLNNEVRIPGYRLKINKERIPESKEFSAFKEHVLKLLKGIDIGNLEDEGFRLETLNNLNDRNGYESNDKIIYEGDNHIWTAKITGISFVSVSVEKKTPGIGNLSELDN